MLIFSNNVWISVDVPIGHDPTWSNSDIWYYCLMKAASTTQIAEAATYKRKYGVTYTKELEKSIDLVSRK
jgi:hypothetical protein